MPCERVRAKVCSYELLGTSLHTFLCSLWFEWNGKEVGEDGRLKVIAHGNVNSLLSWTVREKAAGWGGSRGAHPSSLIIGVPVPTFKANVKYRRALGLVLSAPGKAERAGGRLH